MILPIAELIEWLIARGGIELINLGKLKEIKDLRKVWPHEAIDFTPWLAEEDNLALLADAVGLEITVDETESSVGDFNVDIYATETGTDRKIIIENQLEDTNHDHLGKLITYASGKSADIHLPFLSIVLTLQKLIYSAIREQQPEKRHLRTSMSPA